MWRKTKVGGICRSFNLLTLLSRIIMERIGANESDHGVCSYIHLTQGEVFVYLFDNGHYFFY